MVVEVGALSLLVAEPVFSGQLKSVLSEVDSVESELVAGMIAGLGIVAVGLEAEDLRAVEEVGESSVGAIQTVGRWVFVQVVVVEEVFDLRGEVEEYFCCSNEKIYCV